MVEQWVTEALDYCLCHVISLGIIPFHSRLWFHNQTKHNISTTINNWNNHFPYKSCKWALHAGWGCPHCTWVGPMVAEEDEPCETKRHWGQRWQYWQSTAALQASGLPGRETPPRDSRQFPLTGTELTRHDFWSGNDISLKTIAFWLLLILDEFQLVFLGFERHTFSFFMVCVLITILVFTV